MSIGGYTDYNFKSELIELKINNKFYLYTDGYSDQFRGDKNKKFKLKRLKNLILDTSNKKFDYQKDNLNTEFVNWKKDIEQIDDVCIIGFKI